MYKIKKYIYCLLTFLLWINSPFAQSHLINEVKNKLSQRGIELEFNYKGEVFSNISGGVENKSVYLDNIDLIFNFDLEKLFGWEGATLNSYILGNHGGLPSENSGALQGISNIAAHNTWKLYEFWIQQKLLDNNLSILFGLYDLNSEFDNRVTSGIFINPSHGIGPEYAFTGKNGPSIFPTTSLALRMSYKFTNSINFNTALLDGIPGDLNNPNGTRVIIDERDGLLISSEITYSSNSDELEQNYFKYSVGAWYYTGKFQKLLPKLSENNTSYQNGNFGLYMSLEQFLLCETDLNNQGMSGFLRVGIADRDVNIIDTYLGAGISYKGMIPGRDDDIIGIAAAAAHKSENYVSIAQSENPGIITKDYEYIFEITYSVMLMNYLRIQPNIQFVLNPDGNLNADHALALGTRMELAL